MSPGGGEEPRREIEPVINAGINAAIWEWTRRIVGQLEHDGIPAIVLKGPRQSAWLHRDQNSVHSSDIDLLVRAQDSEALEWAFAKMGFDKRVANVVSLIDPLASSVWSAPYVPAEVDVHYRLWGVDGPGETAWRLFWDDRAEVDGVSVLGPTASVLHVVLHVAQHGRKDVRTTRDLEALLRLTTRETWTQVTELARSVGALGALRAGLQIHPEGYVLVESLGLASTRIPPDVAGQAEGEMSELLALRHLRRMDSWRARLTLLRLKILPPKAFLEYWYPEARTGVYGLFRAHGRRWARISVGGARALAELVMRRRR